jgi:fermentation-respiration switch protein FrsA (DUF1100 family)
MYPLAHRILVVVYAVLPLAGLAWAVHRSNRRGNIEPLVNFLVTCFSGIILGTAIVIIHGMLLHGSIQAGQVLQSWYFLLGLLCVMGSFRWLVREGSWRLFRVARDERGRPIHPGGVRAALASTLQAVLLVGLGLPLVAGTLLVHRVRVNTGGTPTNLADCDYEDVSFAASDGVRIAGWWVPAEATRDRPLLHRTVLMGCGVGDDLANQAGLLRVLVSGGYNVLAFNLRGNGDSGGQWISFGDVERRDVLGAVRWLKGNHPEETKRIYGLGGGAGGAALIGAATDPGAEGQSIDALAVFDTYADFHALAESTIKERLYRPFRPWAMRVLLPIASAHAGADLGHFAPASLVSQLWPRPILVIHGRGDGVVPFSQGQDLFRGATFPKQALWLSGDHAGVYQSRRGAGTVLEFFDHAEAVPAI